MSATSKMNEMIRRDGSNRDSQDVIGSALGFAAKEAYKLLRTNLMFALSGSDPDRGHIVGVTSALRGEGKSTTVLNLAGVFAEQGKRVVVVEGDLRLPNIRKKLKIRSKHGLSNILLDRGDPLRYVQRYKVGVEDEKLICFDVLLAGEIPPNPSELLGSKNMGDILQYLAKRYDLVLLDLPPVTAVSDALVATKLVDGIVFVVRNEYCDTRSLHDAIRQLQFVESHILGFVMTDANQLKSSYRKKYKYKYYYSEEN